MSFAIALSGGGARGAAHVGVLLALEESGIYPKAIAGTSAGGIIAGLYATGTTPRMLKEIVLKASKVGQCYMDVDLAGIIKAMSQFIVEHKIGLTGLIKGNRLEYFLNQQTKGKNIKDANIRIIIPSVDINSGYTIAYTNSLVNVRAVNKVKWKTDIRVSEAMRASSAFPTIFKPKFIDGMCLVDGGVTDVLPVDLLIAAGEHNVLAVDIGQNYKIPKNKNMIDIASHSLSIMSNSLKECHSHGERLLLKPSLPAQSGLLTFDQMVKCMDAGYEATKANIPVIRAIFG